MRNKQSWVIKEVCRNFIEDVYQSNVFRETFFKCARHITLVEHGHFTDYSFFKRKHQLPTFRTYLISFYTSKYSGRRKDICTYSPVGKFN